MYMARQNRKNRSWREARKCRSYVRRKKRQRARRAIRTFFASAWGGLAWLLEKLARIPWIYIKALCLAVASEAVTLWRWFWPYKVKGEPKFHSLAPTKNAERIDIYKEALSQALQDQSILNIAVAGAYGSGKSSFLRTYFKENPSFWPFGGKKNKVITISLAELAAKSEEPKPEEIGKKHLITRQEVELSILHQLFFHERSGSLADSHFTKIQKFGFWKLWFYTTCLVLYIVSCIHLLKPGLWTTTLRLEELQWDISVYRTWWHWIFVGIAIAGTIWLSRYLIRVIAQLTVRKLSVETAKIEIASKLEKSILNAHIDEIIYFFSATGYNVVLLEDLDRFKQQNIFVKLREINHLINNSEEVKQPVRFIYALRDEMFVNEERTKFFDFIIPIIPRVDISNAGDVLHTLMPDYLGNAVDAVAMYMHDTRMLYNIANEFNIYKYQQFKKSRTEEDVPKLDVRGEEQLLTLIVYKNLYPEDFEKLRTQKQGLLAHAIDEKKALLDQNLQKIDTRINEINDLLNEAEDEQLQDEKELRMLVIAEVLKGALLASNSNYVYNKIKFGDQVYAISELEKTDKFALFQKAKSYVYYVNTYGPTQPGIPYAKIVSTIFSESTYEKRLGLIRIKADDSAYQEELQKLEGKKSHLNNSTLQELLRNKEIDIEWRDYGNEEYSDQRRFVRDMLFLGYITENYADYISFFHPGYMTNNDYQFIRSVRNQEKLGFDFWLKNTHRIIEKLDAAYFLQPEILNYALMDTLLESFPKSAKCNNAVSVIEQYTQESIDFIAGYVYAKGQNGKLIKRLCADGKNLWKVISKSRLRDDVKHDILRVIVSYAEEDNVVANLEGSMDYLSSMSDYFTWEVDRVRLQNVAKRLNLHFTKLDKRTDTSFLTYVYENNLFEISKDMLEHVLPKEIVEDERYHTSNYTYLHDVAPKSLIDYLEKHLEQYVRNVLLEMSTDTQEKSLHESAILSSDVSIDLKDKLIRQGTEKWDSVNQWDEQTKDVQLMLYKYNRVRVAWENVCYLYDLDKEAFVQYLHNENVVDELHQQGTPSFKDEKHQETWIEIQKAIISNKELKKEAGILMDCFDMQFEQPELANCDRNLLRQLVDKGKVATGIEEFNLLHNEDRELCWKFFVDNFESYTLYLDKLNFYQKDVENLFEESCNLSEKQKLQTMVYVQPGLFSRESTVCAIDFLLQSNMTEIEVRTEGVEPLIKMLLFMPEVSTPLRIQLFNKYPLTDMRDIDEMIMNFDSDYAENGRLHQMPNTPETYKMCTYLMQKGYLKNRKKTKGNPHRLSISYPHTVSRTAPLY